ncbi:MAG: response regulator [Candidatus Roizmanbacteria bacterium]|nr:response regulator [Candidatus Roizmanbacteria bacterium]
MIKKILIVEDESAIQKVLIDTLTKAGYKSILAKNSQEALQKFKEKKPDLILLDIIMPGESGFDVLEKIRVKYDSKVPVIIVSNLREKDDVVMGKNLGVVEYILKSDISLKNLMLKIHQTLSN